MFSQFLGTLKAKSEANVCPPLQFFEARLVVPSAEEVRVARQLGLQGIVQVSYERTELRSNPDYIRCEVAPGIQGLAIHVSW